MTDMLGSSGMAIQYTPTVIQNQLVSDITGDQSQQASLETQISTGNQVNVPSDNPAQAVNILQLQAAMTRAQQYSTNATDGLGWLSLGNSTLNQVLSALQQAHQVVLSSTGANLTGQSSVLQGLADQVDSVRQQVVELSNTLYGGQALFAGTGNVTQAYDATGTYTGGGSAPTRTVAPGVQVPVSLTGPTVFGTGATGLLGNSVGNVGVLAQISADLRAGNITAVTTTDLGNLQNAINVVQDQSAVLGSAYQQMQSFSNQANYAQQALQTELSGAQSTDMPKTITELTQSQDAYQAALWAASKISQDSLVSFLG